MTVHITSAALDVLKLLARGITPGAITWDIQRELLRERLVIDGATGLQASDLGKRVVEELDAKDALQHHVINLKPGSTSGGE